jgi:signal transduction histidine kinase
VLAHARALRPQRVGQFPGVGLGLYLAQHVVEQLNGRITVESKEGRGTTFTMLLPRWGDSINSDAKPEENADAKAVVNSR